MDAATKRDDKEGFQRKILTNKDQILSVLNTPKTYDAKQSAILISDLLVKMEDNSVFEVRAYINQDAFKEKDEFIRLTEQVFATLCKGTRINMRNAHEETLNIFETKKDFVFAVPENYNITIDQKYDFQVFEFHKFSGYEDTDWVSLTIYVGNHPSFFYREYDFEESNSTEASSKFLDKNISWLMFHDASRGIYLKEQKIQSENIGKDLIVHIAMMANTASSISELTKIVESIKVK